MCFNCIDFVSVEYKLLFYGIEVSRYPIKYFLTLLYFRSNCCVVITAPETYQSCWFLPLVLCGFVVLCFGGFWGGGGFSFVCFPCDQKSVQISNLGKNVPLVSL